MELYDPENPLMFSTYKLIQLSNAVAYNLSRYLKHEDLMLAVNNAIVGKMSSVCNRLFCQSKLINGIIKVETPYQVSLGHLVLVHSFAHHFIPVSDPGFAVDKSILYKKELDTNCQRVTIYG